MRLAATVLASAAFLVPRILSAQVGSSAEPSLPIGKLATENFGADAPWYQRNIPFIEIDDPQIQQIYFYRWKLFRSHIREIGEQGQTTIEFLPPVPWARKPWEDLNDSTSFHLLEGRWMRDPSVIDSLINHAYAGGGNDRHFSEWIASAANSTTLVTGDPGPALKHLEAMESIYNQWTDHFDREKGLYWIEPLLDATEYTISSIDASGAGFTDKPSPDQNRNGFTQGFSYRPSINSYQYANALAIARLAKLQGKPEVAEVFERRAAAIRNAVQNQLWNVGFGHFTDRYQRSTENVTANDFVRGRELVGYTPWMFELPDKDESDRYATAWEHVLNPNQLGGRFGMRTVEPTYAKYMQQYRYEGARPECQWNGPSWPFQTSQTLTGMANLLNDYPPAFPAVTASDYLRLLRQFTQQHYLSPGHPDIEEDYNPDTGKPIVGLERSHHYSHSTYVDLVLNGLIGIRPRTDEVLEINPLVPEHDQKPIRYFALEHVAYHGHDIGVIYDRDGSRYKVGSGLSVFIDGKRAAGPKPLGKLLIDLPKREPRRSINIRHDLAANVGLPDGPKGSASSSMSEKGIAEAIDGRMWFFPENVNGWSPAAGDASPWYSVDFGKPRRLTSVELYFAEDTSLKAPATLKVQVKKGAEWADVEGQHHAPEAPIAGGENTITFAPVESQAVRVVLTKPASNVRLIELKAFGPE